MCDDQGISDEKVKVFSIVDMETAPSNILFEDIETLMEHIKTSAENLCDGDPEYDFTISVRMVRRSALNNLKELEF